MQITSESVGQKAVIGTQRGDEKSLPALASLDFVAVAESHVLLFSRLKHYLQGETENGTGEFVEHQHQCDLGRWLREEGALTFGHLQSFCHLRDIHEEFHQHAEAVLAYLHDGSWIVAERMCKRDLSQALRRVLIALTELNEVMRAQAVTTVN